MFRISSIGRLMSWVSVLTLLILVAFAVLHWLQVPAGRFVDWFIGIVSFWWLMVVVTVPWNIHFEAREVLADAARSVEVGITVSDGALHYARRWAKLSLGFAVALHLLSAGGMYLLAATGISAVGYVSAGAALLLTALRPLMRGYEYLMSRLNAIREGIHYPREDVVKLREEVQELFQRVGRIETHVDPQERNSWAGQQLALARETRGLVDELRVALDEVRITNKSEHAQLARDAEQAIARITTDGQVLDHVRELIRFFKQA